MADKDGLTLYEDPEFPGEIEEPASSEGETGTQEQTSVPEAQQSQEVRSFKYELDPSDLYGSVKRLWEEDPHFRNVTKSLIGREKKTELQKRIAELEAELARERYQRYATMLSTVPEEQLPELVESNEEYREAAQYVQSYDPESSDDGVDYVTFIENALDEAEIWLAPGRADDYRARMSPGGCQCDALPYEHGVFDHDPNGQPLTPLRSFMYFKQILDQEIAFAKASYENARNRQAPIGNGQWSQSENQFQPVSAQTPPPAPEPSRHGVAQALEQMRNPRLAANPDSSFGHVSSESTPITKEDLDRMTPDEIIRRWPNDGDFARDVAANKVLIPGLNA